MSTIQQTIKTISRTFDNFTSRGGAIQMRPYQLEPAKAILNSILNKQGHTIILIISRQAGKDELLANLISYLMYLFSHREVGIVVANPTYKPQTLNFIVRLENRLKANLLTKSAWKKRADYMRMIGSAITSLLSGDKDANVVGATASLLLVINEAQDISPAKFDKDFAPMVASTNATRVIVGTEWTNHTFLARETDAARQEEKQDGIRRVFIYNSDEVRKVNKPYGQFVDSQIRKLGRQHPLVKTQYFCERIDAQTGMFNATRRALMVGDQPSQETPIPGHIYALTIDVGGQDEALLNLDGMGNPGRDYTTADIIDIDLSTLTDLQAPTYRVVQRHAWQGESHVSIFGKIKTFADRWNVQYIVIDATGVGEGLWAMTAKRYPTKTIAIKFTQQTKSEIGYAFIGIIETGRFRDCAPTEQINEQYQNCQSEILIGPAKTMRWGVPDGTRGADGQLIHDDHITADAEVAELDKLQWFIQSETQIFEQADILQEYDRAY